MVLALCMASNLGKNSRARVEREVWDDFMRE